MQRHYGYCRISDKGQCENRQVEALINAGVEERFIFIDKQSGKDFDRPQWLVLKNALRENDLLTILSIDRLGRDYEKIRDEWQDITKNIKADIQVLDMPLLDTRQSKDLMGTFVADLVLQILSFAAANERNYIRSRQRAGIDLALRNGIRFGRPTIGLPENFQNVYRRWKSGEITAVVAMRILNLKKSTFYKFVRDYEH